MLVINIMNTKTNKALFLKESCLVVVPPDA